MKYYNLPMGDRPHGGNDEFATCSQAHLTNRPNNCYGTYETSNHSSQSLMLHETLPAESRRCIISGYLINKYAPVKCVLYDIPISVLRGSGFHTVSSIQWYDKHTIFTAASPSHRTQYSGKSQIRCSSLLGLNVYWHCV